MVEIFKPIKDYERIYEISNLGRIKSLERIVKGKDNSFRKIKTKILKQAINKNGYLKVVLSKNNKCKTKTIHQLLAVAFLNHTPNGYKTVVDHKNNIKTDNRLDNLQLVSNRKNTSKDKKNCTSKYTGVCWSKKLKKWCSSIRINGKKKHLGYFENEIDASDSYQKALIL